MLGLFYVRLPLNSLIVDLYFYRESIKLDKSVISFVAPDMTFLRFSGSFYNLLLNIFLLSLRDESSGMFLSASDS